MTIWITTPQKILHRSGTIMILMHLIRNEHMNVSRIFPFAVGIFAATQLAAQSPSPTTLIKAGRLIEPRSGNVLALAGSFGACTHAAAQAKAPGRAPGTVFRDCQHGPGVGGVRRG